MSSNEAEVLKHKTVIDNDVILNAVDALLKIAGLKKINKILYLMLLKIQKHWFKLVRNKIKFCLD